MSEIRALLAAAQQAETRGDKREAVRLLKQVADLHVHRGQEVRASKVLRHIARLQESGADRPEGEVDDGPPVRVLEERRPLLLAERTVDAWCSFCCRPRREVGALVQSPTGAFICRACTCDSQALLGDQPPTAAAVVPQKPAELLHAQKAAQARLRATLVKLTLLVGPEGSGKSTVLRSLGEPAQSPSRTWPGDLALIDLARPWLLAEEAHLLEWLDAQAQRRAIVSVRGSLPAPLVVLQGELGAEPIFDTAALCEATAQLSLAALARVEAVVALAPPDQPSLQELAKMLLTQRGSKLPLDVVSALADAAHRSDRGAHELVALIARIPREASR